ncbi:MAG TPA: hypothetical protein VGL44_14520 [Gaiellales bacterium]
MRIARIAVFLIAAVSLASCGGGSAHPPPFNEHTLLSESATATSAVHSAKVRLAMTARILHTRPLPAGMSPGPYSVAVTGAFEGGTTPLFDMAIRVSAPGETYSITVLSTGRVLYYRLPGGGWYSLSLTALGTGATPQSTPDKAIRRFLEERERHWLIDVGARRARSKDVLTGDVDMGAFTRDLDTVIGRLQIPPSDAGLLDYLATSVDDPSWRLTFDHATHLLSGVHAIDEIDFNSVERQELHQPMPFGLPYQIDGISLALSAHIGDWGTRVHITPPANATPVTLPGGAASVADTHTTCATTIPTG